MRQNRALYFQIGGKKIVKLLSQIVQLFYYIIKLCTSMQVVYTQYKYIHKYIINFFLITFFDLIFSLESHQVMQFWNAKSRVRVKMRNEQIHFRILQKRDDREYHYQFIVYNTALFTKYFLAVSSLSYEMEKKCCTL